MSFRSPDVSVAPMLSFAMENVKAASNDEGSAQPCPGIGPFREEQPAEQGGPYQRDIGKGRHDGGRCAPESLDEKEVAHAAQETRRCHKQPVLDGWPLPMPG